MSTVDLYATAAKETECTCPPSGELYRGSKRLCTRPGCPVHAPTVSAEPDAPTSLKTAREALAWSFTLAGLNVPEDAERATQNVENLIRAILAEGGSS